MSANETGRGNVNSPAIPESGTSLDYLWNAQPEERPAAESAAPPKDKPARDLSSTSIFRFTLSEYRDWLKSFDPK